MSITSELRAWAKEHLGRNSILAIADRIDAEHEEAIASMMNDALYHANDKDMADLGWYRALDADGVPIRMGDVLTDGEYKFKVFELAAFGDGSWSIRNEDGNAWATCDVTHYHEPTVEDVLREFAEGLGVPVADSYIAASAIKLRLAGDAE